MDLLVDTNVLLRAFQLQHPQNAVALTALDRLKGRGDRLYVVPQVLYEFWVVCTRPEGENGLGLTAPLAFRQLERVKRLFVVLPDTPEVYPQWERIVAAHEVLGKQAHDARLVAAMNVYRLTHVLTFNGDHFTRYAEISWIHPQEVAV